MKKFQDWQQTQTYFQHLSQLTKIRIRKPIYTPQKNKKDQTKRKQSAYKTEPAENSEKIQKMYLPLHLIPNTQRAIMQRTLNYQKSLPLKEKQIILENFLLSKRIINTLPVISKKEQDRQYKIYKKASRVMNKSINTSQQSVRSEKLLEYRGIQDYKQPHGVGNSLIIMKIISMAFIRLKIQNNEDNLLQVKLYLGKKYLKSKFYNISQFMLNQLVFAFRKRDIINDYITAHIMLIKKNELMQLGRFKVSLANYLVVKQLYKTKSIQQICKHGVICGTIEFDLAIEKK